MKDFDFRPVYVVNTVPISKARTLSEALLYFHLSSYSAQPATQITLNGWDITREVT